MPVPAKDWRTRLAWELRAARRLTVLGAGNPDRGDDVAGSLCARRLARALLDSPLFSGPGKQLQAARPLSRRGPGLLGRFAPRPGGPPGCSSRKSALMEIQVLDGGSVPESTTGLIREFRPTHVLIVDAASAGREPGSVLFIDKKRIDEDDLSAHRIPLSHLVRYLEETVGCRVILLGIEPRCLEPGKKVSRPVRKAAKAVSDTLAGWMRL